MQSVFRELRDWGTTRNGIAAAVTATGVLAVILGLAMIPANAARSPIFAAVNVLVPAVAVVCAFLASRHSALPHRARLAWRCCAAAFAVTTVGHAAWLLADHAPHASGMAAIGEAGHLLYYPFLLTGILLFPSARRTRSAVLKLTTDVAIVAVVCGAMLWYLVLRPAMTDHPVTGIAAFLAIAYPVLDFVVLFGISLALLGSVSPATRRPLQLLGVAGLGMFLANAAYGHEIVWTSAFKRGHWTDLGWTLAATVWVWAAQYQRWRATKQAQAPDDVRAEREPNVLPYLAALVGYGLLATVSYPYWDDPIGPVIGATIVLTLAVLIRQIAVTREHARIAEKQLRYEGRFRSLIQHSSDVITVIDAENVIRFMSPAVERVFGWTPESAVGRNVLEIVHRDDTHSVLDLIDRLHREQGASASAVWRCRNSAGEWRHIETVATCLLHDPAVRGIVLNTRDVSDRMAMQAELSRQAFHDPLTNLANRAWFHSQVEQALVRAADTPENVAVFFLDLDNFKHVNDSLGHSEGDRMLKIVAERLLNATRGSDTVARLGGDEFAVLVERIDHLDGLTTIAARITSAMRQPFKLAQGDVFSGGSIGIARGAPGDRVDDVLRNADVAMYVSKRRGKGAYTVFEQQMHDAARLRLGIETDLRLGIEHEQFMLLFQPIVSLDTEELVGAEALVRWRHPKRGLLTPDQFIPIAEESGHILALGRWVLEHACRQAMQWRSLIAVDRPFTIAVNVSGRQLQQPSFVDDVAAALWTTGLPPEDLLLEITESVIMDDVEATAMRLEMLKGLGVRIAIDDFGTGYSSLGALQRFPIDVIKIDKSFVNGTAEDENSRALARTIVALGASLSLQTVAEGVEQAQQARVLHDMGCFVAQGFHFSRPVDPDTISEMVRTRCVRLEATPSQQTPGHTPTLTLVG